MVKALKRALGMLAGYRAGVLLEGPVHREDDVVIKACALRGARDPNLKACLFFAAGDRQSVLRRLQEVVLEGERPRYAFGENERVWIVAFRGAFADSGHFVRVEGVRLSGNTIDVCLVYEDLGNGLRTSGGSCQPCALIPLSALPRGRYNVRLHARHIWRTSSGSETREQALIGSSSFRIHR